MLRLMVKLPEEDAVVVGRTIISLLGYADDLAFLATSAGAMQRVVSSLDEVCELVGMQVSLDKTKVMFSGPREDCEQVLIREHVLKRSDAFPYLGVVQSCDATSARAVQHRISKASAAFYSLSRLWKAPMRLSVKGHLYMAIVRRVLLYGAGTWTLRQEDCRILETFDMACIRSILRVSKIRRIPSVDLRARLGIHKSVGQEIKQDRVRLFGHAMRMDMDSGVLLRWPRIVVEDAACGTRGRRGRPQKCWIHNVNSDLVAKGFGLYSGAHLARKNRTLFRNKLVI